MRTPALLTLTSIFLITAFASHANADENTVVASDSDVTPVAPKKEPTKVRGFIDGGASYGRLFDTGMTATSLEGGLAIQTSKHVGTSIGLNVDLGKTQTGGLATHDIALFGTVDGIVGPLRFGVGPQLSYFSMSRAASSTQDSTIGATGLGLRARVSIDLLSFDDKGRGLFLAITPHIEWLRGDFLNFTTGTTAWSANGTAGLRF